MRDFTPGPWRIISIEGGMVAIDGANGEEVTGFVSPEDGRLIAAAPELLGALIALYAVAEVGRDEDYGAVTNAAAAIAKATGEQS